MKNYTILMNRHNIGNGNFETHREAIERVRILKEIFKFSLFEIVIN